MQSGARHKSATELLATEAETLVATWRLPEYTMANALTRVRHVFPALDAPLERRPPPLQRMRAPDVPARIEERPPVDLGVVADVEGINSARPSLAPPSKLMGWSLRPQPTTHHP